MCGDAWPLKDMQQLLLTEAWDTVTQKLWVYKAEQAIPDL